jgi:hypothetical protein
LQRSVKRPKLTTADRLLWDLRERQNNAPPLGLRCNERREQSKNPTKVSE